MTNKEALAEVLGITLSDAAIEKAFADALAAYGLTGAGTYSNANEEGIDWIAYKLLSNFIAADISEGGYSISYRDTIEKKILRLQGRWGFEIEEDEAGAVEDISFLW